MGFAPSVPAPIAPPAPPQQSPTALAGKNTQNAANAAGGMGLGGTILTSGDGLNMTASTASSKQLLGS